MLILTVLKSGGDYKPEHVERLHGQWQQFAPCDSSFLCLTDMGLPSYIQSEPLEHGWPGWWSKIEIFKHRGPVLYMDLDTSIIGPLAPLCLAATTSPFVALRDFNPTARDMGSGLMAWNGDQIRIYEEFLRDPELNMARCKTPQRWGDQGFIEQLAYPRVYWQNILPGLVVSYKKHCKGGKAPHDAHVVCFHGKPRPWDVGW